MIIINTFLSALISIFFLGKSTKEVQEKTRNASWFRTFVYLFLTIIFCIFFYKSYQVKTIINRIDISALRGAEDSLGNPIDTIQHIKIVNAFNTLGSYENQLFDVEKANIKSEMIGGAEIKLNLSDYSEGKIKNSGGLTDSLKNRITAQTGKKIDANTGSIYRCEFFSTNIPSLIHVYPSIRLDEPKVQYPSYGATIENKGNVVGLNLNGRIGISKSNPSKGYYVDGLSYQKTSIFYDEKSVRENFDAIYIHMPHQLVNSMDFFTAGDLSQYTYCIVVNSDLYVNRLDVVYNVPIEVSNQAEGLVLHANAFSVVDAELLNKEIGSRPMMFLVKLPSMANLQQIRSLLLTAIITALFSLFCTNLFYRVRKWAIQYKRNHGLKISELRQIDVKRINNYRWFLYIIVFSLLTIILVVVLMSALGYVFLIEYDNLGWKIIGLLLCVVVILVIAIYKSYKYAITPPTKQRDDAGAGA